MSSQGATTPTPTTVAGRDSDDGLAEEEAGGIDGTVGIDPFPSSPSGIGYNRISTFSNPNGQEMVMDGRGTVEEPNQGTRDPVSAATVFVLSNNLS